MKGSEYIRWAKSRERFTYAIGRSSIRPCPPELLAAGPEDFAINGPNAHGWKPLRDALGERFAVDADRVVLATGTSMANHLACAALLEPGDEVVVESPGYEPLWRLPEYLGASIRRFRRTPAPDFELRVEDVEAALTRDTRLVIVSDPHNPSGRRADPRVMDGLAALARDRGFHVLVDEVYLEFCYRPGEDRIAACRGDAMISTCSLTKAYGLDGLRAGWIVASPGLARRFRELNDLFGIIMPHPSERLALRALRRIDVLREDVAALLHRNLPHVQRFIDARGELSWLPPDVGPVGFVRLRGDTDELVRVLERDYDSTAPPGRFFGAPDHFRIGFGMLTEQLEPGLDRLGAALDRLQRKSLE